ncbi:MAG TPA: YceI family protein [Acidimicrobiales bacterium]|jgi:polyisoprenoid-binding protein YceI
MSSRAKVLIAVAVLVLVAAGAGVWWFLKGDAPDAVSLDAAVDQVDGGATNDTTATTAASGVEGTWTIDAETGAFDFETATGTFAGFRVDEELAGIGASTAVGRTGDVTGDFTIEGTTVTEATFEVDLTTITTNESRRDNRVQDALETSSFPTATFTLTEPLELGAGAADGDSVSVTAVGDLTIHGETQSVEFPLEAQLVDDTVVLVGSLNLTFSDYGVMAPTSPIALSVDDHGILELQFLLTAT